MILIFIKTLAIIGIATSLGSLKQPRVSDRFFGQLRGCGYMLLNVVMERKQRKCHGLF